MNLNKAYRWSKGGSFLDQVTGLSNQKQSLHDFVWQDYTFCTIIQTLYLFLAIANVSSMNFLNISTENRFALTIISISAHKKTLKDSYDWF